MKPRSGVTPGKKLPKDMNDREWATFLSDNGFQGADRVKTFQPEWFGFSVDPVGEISYMDFGAIVMMWTEAAVVGTSDAVSMAITNLPPDLQPNAGFIYPQCDVVNGGVIYRGNVLLTGGSAAMSFGIDEVSGINITANSIGFAAVNGKGLPAGWLITYPK